MGDFNLSFAGQPVAHTDGLWNFLALAHNLGLASSAQGVTQNGKAGFAVATAVALFVAVYNTFFNKGKAVDA